MRRRLLIDGCVGRCSIFSPDKCGPARKSAGAAAAKRGSFGLCSLVSLLSLLTSRVVPGYDGPSNTMFINQKIIFPKCDRPWTPHQNYYAIGRLDCILFIIPFNYTIPSETVKIKAYNPSKSPILNILTSFYFITIAKASSDLLYPTSSLMP